MKYILLLLFIVVAVGTYKYSERFEAAYQQESSDAHAAYLLQLNAILKKSKGIVTAYVENEKELKVLEHAYDQAIGDVHAAANQELASVIKPWEEEELPERAQKSTIDIVSRYVKDIGNLKAEIDKARKNLEQREEAIRSRLKDTALEEKENEELLLKKDQDALIAWINGQSSNVRRFNSDLLDQLDNYRTIYEKAVITACKRLKPIERRLTRIYADEYERAGQRFMDTDELVDPFLQNFENRLNDIRGKYLMSIRDVRTGLMSQERSLRNAVLTADKISSQYEQEHSLKLQKHERFLLYIKIIACLLCFTLFASAWFAFASSKKPAR